MDPPPPPPDPPSGVAPVRPPTGEEVAGFPPPVPVRHRTLEELPPAVAERLRFDKAAPRRLRSDKLPPAVQEELRELWDGIAADVYDEVAGLRRTKALNSATVERALWRVANRLLQAERVVIFAAVHYPLKGDKAGRHVAVAGVGGASAATAEALAVYGSMGTAAAVAILSAVVGEVFETYVAASARTRQYLQAQRSPDPDVVSLDLAEASGYATSVGRRATPRMARDAAGWLSERLLARTASRFARGLVPVLGVALGAGMSAWNVRQVVQHGLRPAAADELLRLADQIVNDPEAYAEARRHYLELDGDEDDGDVEVDGDGPD